MVDSSIVVLENIFRRRTSMGSAGGGRGQGASEVATAIVASTLTTLVIFLPVVFIQGVSGQLFREMAYVVCFSLVCSLLVSLSWCRCSRRGCWRRTRTRGRRRKTEMAVVARLALTAERCSSSSSRVPQAAAIRLEAPARDDCRQRCGAGGQPGPVSADWHRADATQ